MAARRSVPLLEASSAKYSNRCVPDGDFDDFTDSSGSAASVQSAPDRSLMARLLTPNIECPVSAVQRALESLHAERPVLIAAATPADDRV